MVDWLDISWPLKPSEIDALVNAGTLHNWGNRIIRVDPTGEVVSEKRIPEAISSDSTSVFLDIGCGEGANRIRINGNLAKWKNKQNVFGDDSPEELLSSFLQSLPLFLGAEISMPPLFVVELKRIDLTQSVWLDDEDQVLDVLNILGYTAKRRKSKNALDGTTMYFGKHSGEWSTKLYSKFHEVKRQPQEGIDPESIRGLLRVEHVLRKHIARNLWTFKDFCSESFRDDVYCRMFDYLTIPEAQMENRITHISLPADLRPYWREWVSGTDMKPNGGFFKSQATAYRWRGKLYKHGVDIFGPVNLEGVENRKNCVSFALAQLRNTQAWAKTIRKAA